MIPIQEILFGNALGIAMTVFRQIVDGLVCRSRGNKPPLGGLPDCLRDIGLSTRVMLCSQNAALSEVLSRVCLAYRCHRRPIRILRRGQPIATVCYLQPNSSRSTRW